MLLLAELIIDEMLPCLTMMEKKYRGRKAISTCSESVEARIVWISNVVYRYFGRAKELPGVKELFQGRKKEEDEENQALAFYKKFQQQGPAYYGDLDEKDEQLIKFERKTEEEGENYRLQLN